MDGVVVLLKAPGMTSSNAVYDVRRIFSEKRAGHTGTLDPGAATAVSVAALIANVAAIIYIAYRAKKLSRNPYKQDVFEGTSDWEKATARRAKVDYAHAE